MSLDVRIEGERLDLPQGSYYELKRQHPFFQKDAVVGGSVASFKVPFTPTNDRILGRLWDVRTVAGLSRWYCEKYVNTNCIERGYVGVNSAVDEYDLYYTDNLSEAFGAWRTRKLSEVDFGTMALPSNYSDTLTNAWNSTWGVVFPTIDNADFYGTSAPGGFSGKVNDYTSGSYTAGVKVPMVLAKWLLQKIATLTDFTFSGPWWDDAATDRLLLYNLRSLDGLTNIRIQDHLPVDWTVGGLLLQLTKLHNVVPFFDVPNRRIRFEYASAVLSAPVTRNWTAKARPRPPRMPAATSGLELSWLLDSGDATAKIADSAFASYITPGIPTDDRAGGLWKMAFGVAPLQQVGGLPYTRQPGITPAQSDKKGTPRLLYWHGLSGGVPLASSTFSAYSLNLNGLNGIYDRYWQAEDLFRQSTFSVQHRVTLNAGDLAWLLSAMQGKTDEHAKIHIGGINYLVSELVAPLPLRGDCLLTGYRI